MTDDRIFRLQLDIPMDPDRMGAVLENLAEIVSAWIEDPHTTADERARLRWVRSTLDTSSRELASYAESRERRRTH